MLQKIRPYAKAAVAVATFVALVAGQVADGHIDVNAIYVGAVALLGALGVYRIPNKSA